MYRFTALVDEGLVPDVERGISEARHALKEAGADVALNDSDPTGDGDQAPLRNLDKDTVYALKTLVACGGDIAGHASIGKLTFLSKHLSKPLLPTSFAQLRAKLQALDQQSLFPSDALIHFLEMRETPARLSPLLLLLSMRNQLKGEPDSPSNAAFNQAHVKTAKWLLQYGARPDAKDVLGWTVFHHAAAGLKTDRTALEIVNMCAAAAKSSSLFGKKVELFGLQNEQMNGIKGVARGYVVDAGRRVVRLLSDPSRTLSVKPENLRLADETAPLSVPNLCNVQGRLGDICLTVAFDCRRVDVVQFLLGQHPVCIDIEPWDGGRSPRILSAKPIDGVKGKCLSLIRKHGIQQALAMEKALDLAMESNDGVKLDKVEPSVATVLMYVLGCESCTWPESLTGTFRKPDHVAVDEKFLIMVGLIGVEENPSPQMSLLFICDESGELQYYYPTGSAGFEDLYDKVTAEESFGGRLTYMWASFDADGDCTVYPNSTHVDQ